MLISFSGTGSSGKTTLLRELRAQRPAGIYIDEVTRLVKKEYGVPINENAGDLTQNLILAKHLENIANSKKWHKNAVNGVEPMIVLDRCILDGWIYSEYLYSKGIVSRKVAEYAFYLCTEYITECDLIFYPDPRDIELVDDGERSTNKKFRDEIQGCFESVLPIIDEIVPVVVLKGSVFDRMKTIKNYL